MANYLSLDGIDFKRIVAGGAAMLKAKAVEVNNLNVFPVPDGDTGDNMTMTILAGVTAVESNESDHLGEVSAMMSRGMLLGARGNSGVILSQFFSGIAKKFEGAEECDVSLLGEALLSGVKQAYRSVMAPTEGTILTVAREGVTNALEKITSDITVNELFHSICDEMRTSLRNTPELLPVLKESGVVDSGGAGLLYIFDGMTRVLDGDRSDEIVTASAAQKAPSKATVFDQFTEDSVMTYGYCTEFLLRLQTAKVDVKSFDESVVTDYLKTVGDSIVAFRDGSIVKVHVHTMTPEKVLAFCRQFGEFLTVKIENMSVQHSETLNSGVKKEQVPEAHAPEKEYGTVAVCSGDGIRKTFLELGVDYIIDGGQTNNPSTEDFVNAFKRVHARHIFVFPNNSNIILAAKQAAQIYKDAQIHVVESKDLGSGYVGIASFNPEADSANELMEMMTDAMQNVVTGCVSPAIRTTDVGGVHIENGDFICFVGKKMIASEKKKNDALRKLIDDIFGADEKFMLTVFCGRNTVEGDKDELRAYMKKTYPDVELYLVDGGQDVYQYILIAE